MRFKEFNTVWLKNRLSNYLVVSSLKNKNNTFTRIISAPGLKIQRLTTREPDDSQIEVAISAIKPCIPENMEDDIW